MVDPASQAHLWPTLWKFIRVSIGVALLILLFHFIDWPSFWNMLRQASPIYILLAFGINIVNLILSAWRWQVLLASDDIHVPLIRLIRYYLISLFFNSYLPPFIGADTVRILSIKESKSVGVRIVSVLIERGSGLLVLLIFGSVAIFVNSSLNQYAIVDIFLLFTLIVLIGALFVLLVPESWQWLLNSLARFSRLHEILIDVAATGKRYRAKPKVLIITLMFSGLIQLLIILAFDFRALTFGVNIPIWEILIVAPSITLLTLLPISPGGIGTQETFYLLMFRMIGIDQTTALAMALLARVLDLSMGVGGAIAWFTNR